MQFDKGQGHEKEEVQLYLLLLHMKRLNKWFFTGGRCYLLADADV